MIVVINFKVYPESFGEPGLKLAKTAESVAEETGTNIVVCPPITEIYRISKTVKIPVWAQSADAVELGSYTGYVPMELIKSAGGTGTLINHAEHKLKIADIDYLVVQCRKLQLSSCVCTNNVWTSVACATLNPGYVAVEPPELIGGNISVTTAKPEVVEGTVNEIRKVNHKVKILCGAGIKSGKDVKKAIELGTEGVLLASGVVKAKNQRETILDLATAL